MNILAGKRDRSGDPLKLKNWIILPVAVVLLSSMALGMFFKYRQSLEQPRREMGQLMVRGHSAWQRLVTAETRVLRTHLAYLAADSALIAAWKNRDLARLTDLAVPLADRLRQQQKITHFYFVAPDRKVVLRAHLPSRRGDRIDRHTMLTAERTGEESWGLELGPLGTFTLRVVRPWRVEGELLGYLELGMEVEYFTRELATALGVELLAVVRKEFITRDQFEAGRALFGFIGKWSDYPEFVVLHQTMPELPSELMASLSRGHDPLAAMAAKPVRRGERWWWCGVLHQPDAAGCDVADLILLLDASGEVWVARRELFLEIGLGLLLSAGLLTLLWVVTDRIEGQLRASFAALREREEHLATTLNSIGDAVIVTDAGSLVTRMNPVAERLTGWSWHEAMGRPLTEIFRIVNAITRHSVDDPVARVLATGELMGLANHTTLLGRAGAEYQIADSAAPIRDSHGRIGGVILVFRDVSEEYRSRAETERIRASLENAQRIGQMGNWEWEIVDNKLFWSDEIYRIFGVEPRQFGASYEAFLGYVYPDDRAAVQKAVAESMADDKPYSIEHRLIRPNGEVRWVHEQAELIRDENGCPLRMNGTVQDISEHKTLEEQLLQARKMESIGVLAGGIAHDFNNILTPIMMRSQMTMLEAPPDSVIHQNMAEVCRAAERAKDLIRQILDFSRRDRHELMPMQLGPVLKEAVKLLRSTIPPMISLETRLDAREDTVLADPTQILQIILNLVVNATHAIPESGQITIALSDAGPAELPPEFSRKMSPNHCYLKLAVSDTGEGIAPENLPRIFEPFFTTKARGQGTGMGLAVVHGLVENHGGTITVQSEPGRGTTFTVFLPKATAEAVTEAAAFCLSLPGGSERIMLVEDDPAILAAGVLILTQLGYRVTGLTGGAEALASFTDSPADFDLMITDYEIPEMTGVVLAKEVRKIRQELPVILCTGFSEKMNEEKAEEMGFSAFLTKPFALAEFTATIRRVLDPGRK